MENLKIIFTLTVNLIAVVYVLYKFWNFLHSEKITGLWGYLFSKEPVPTPETGNVEKPAKTKDDSIVGKSRTIYLKNENPPDEPAESVPGIDTDNIGEEQDINPDDVEYSIENGNAAPDDEETFMPFEDDEIDERYNEDFSTGLTFSEIANVVDVVKGRNGNETNQVEAAKVLYNTRNTDILDFITTQVSSADAVEKILKENLDLDGMPLKSKKRPLRTVDDFDIDAFVD